LQQGWDVLNIVNDTHRCCSCTRRIDEGVGHLRRNIAVLAKRGGVGKIAGTMKARIVTQRRPCAWY
jgi:hypothetical protein